MSQLSESQLKILMVIADTLLPKHKRMPALSDVVGIREAINKVLEYRPDLSNNLEKVIDECDQSEFSLQDLALLFKHNPKGYEALTTVLAASYYQTSEVRNLIGYPGQVAKTYDPYEYVKWVQEGLLDDVIAKGPIWRDPRKEIV